MKVISNKMVIYYLSLIISRNIFPIQERIINLPPQIRFTPHQKKLVNNHTDANKS